LDEGVCVGVLAASLSLLLLARSGFGVCQIIVHHLAEGSLVMLGSITLFSGDGDVAWVSTSSSRPRRTSSKEKVGSRTFGWVLRNRFWSLADSGRILGTPFSMLMRTITWCLFLSFAIGANSFRRKNWAGFLKKS